MEAVVMSASTGALGVLIPKLGKLLTDKYKLHKGTKEGIQSIQNELKSMKAAIQNVSNVPPDQLDDQVKIWQREARNMSYKIEDTIDSFMVLVDDAGGQSDGSSMTCCASMIGKSKLLQRCKARESIATEIKNIKKEVEEFSRRRERYKIDSITVAPGRSDLRHLARYEDKSKLVGIHQPTEEIISLLSNDEEGASTSEKKLKLVAVVGPGGMGKTTLANVVYQKLEEKFDSTAYVSVSLQPNVKNILSSILRQVMASKDSELKQDQVETEEKDNKNKRVHRRESQKHYGNTETWSETELIDKIKHVLDKRRFFIFIDDIWDEQPWKHIKCALVANKLGSKVIMTTRNNKVAESCCYSDDDVDGIIHKMRPLSDDDCKRLLYYKIFGMERCPTKDLEDVSQRILEKSEGWPLAIITIASLLKSAETKDQWESIYNSISTGLKNNDGVRDMRAILSLSYHDMPAPLRDCFLYLGIFPEDHIIERDDLIQRWIAEDLVHGRQDDNLNELGDKYFNELINRCMIQPRDVDAFGRAHSCTVHDLVLEFVIVKSAEEDFLTILNDKQSFPSDQPDSIHRLSLRNCEGKHGIPKTTNRLPHVRTLIVSSHGIKSMPSLSVFPVLRVLELEDCTKLNIKGVENLVHLRYLRLVQAQGYHFYHDVCIDLPKRIGNLQFLQTLDLKAARIKALPHSVVQFRQLRVLEISLRKWDKTFEKRFIKFLCNVEKLEALCIIAPGLSLDFMLQVNWTTRHLRKFTASFRKQTEHIFRRGSVWAVLSPFSTLPRWINSSLSGLSNLSIMVRTLTQEDIEILAKLPILRSLDLEVVEASGTRLEINGRTTFRNLGNLKFASRAVGLVFKPGAMQQLQNLGLYFDVAETKDVFDDFSFGIAGLENLTSLKILNVEIDCRCARLREVRAAEAALHNAIGLNPSFPTLDLKRHFEDQMLRNEEEEIPEHRQANTKKEDALLSRVGPFGGSGGRARDIRVAPHRLINVTIWSGKNDVVHSLGFSYADHNGQQHSAGPWGGRNFSVKTIPFDTSEYLIKVSGTTGPSHGIHKLITSLTFVTNATTHGPFGKPHGDPFEFHVPSNSSIVGFFGRAGLSLDAIGFYVRPV